MIEGPNNRRFNAPQDKDRKDRISHLTEHRSIPGVLVWFGPTLGLLGEVRRVGVGACCWWW